MKKENVKCKLPIYFINDNCLRLAKKKIIKETNNVHKQIFNTIEQKTEPKPTMYTNVKLLENKTQIHSIQLVHSTLFESVII